MRWATGASWGWGDGVGGGVRELLNSRPCSPSRRVTQPQQQQQQHGGSGSNRAAAEAPLETRFAISPKTGRGRGSRLCFITIGQIAAGRLVYAFLTSLIPAQGGRGDGGRGVGAGGIPAQSHGLETDV